MINSSLFVKNGKQENFAKKMALLKEKSLLELQEKADQERNAQDERKQRKIQDRVIKEKKDAEEQCKDFSVIFCALLRNKHNLTLNAIKNITVEDMKILTPELRKSTRRTAIVCKVLIVFSIPVVIIGWIFAALLLKDIDPRGLSRKFESRFGAIKEFYGEENFPYEYIIQYIQSGPIEKVTGGERGGCFFRKDQEKEECDGYQHFTYY